LGHLTCKTVSEMTYNVSSGTLNSTTPYHQTPFDVAVSAFQTGSHVTFDDVMRAAVAARLAVQLAIVSAVNSVFPQPGDVIADHRQGQRQPCIRGTGHPCPVRASRPSAGVSDHRHRSRRETDTQERTSSVVCTQRIYFVFLSMEYGHHSAHP